VDPDVPTSSSIPPDLKLGCPSHHPKAASQSISALTPSPPLNQHPPNHPKSATQCCRQQQQTRRQRQLLRLRRRRMVATTSSQLGREGGRSAFHPRSGTRLFPISHHTASPIFTSTLNLMEDNNTPQPTSMATDYRSDSSSASSVDHIHAPVPTRPRLPSRKSSGTMIIHRDSVDAGPVDLPLGPDDVRSMSPRRTSEDIETLGKAAREELQRYGFC
jgi:hypothetical protein